MADINAYLREAINGPAPQHKVAGRNQFEISEGSDGATHTKIVDVDGNPLSTFPVEDKAVKAELESIKATQAEILERLDGTFDTRLTGSNLEDGIPVEISGNLVTDLNGYKAMRTKQEALAYKTWFLGDQEVVTVAGGSRFEETSPVLINGFSTISFISRAQDYSRHDYQIRLRWQSVGHGVNGPFSYQEDFDVESDQFNSNVTETKAEYVLGSIMNHDSESHEYHVAFLLRV